VACAAWAARAPGFERNGLQIYLLAKTVFQLLQVKRADEEMRLLRRVPQGLKVK
jgi:hypothetical protein